MNVIKIQETNIENVLQAIWKLSKKVILAENPTISYFITQSP